MDEAAVLAECAAHPDDDGPRLVWADLVGGERGELVVIQCDLARGDLPPAEMAKRRRRERELLEAHALEWAGALSTIATRWSFRRGFIEAARFTRFDAAAVAAHPLLASVTLDSHSLVRDFLPEYHARDFLPASAPYLTLRGLAAQGTVDELEYVAGWPGVGQLRALSIDELGVGALEAARRLIARAPLLEQLWLREYRLPDAEQIESLLAGATKLASLALDSGPWTHRVIRLERPLRALRTDNTSLAALSRISGDTLERLHIRFKNPGRSVDSLFDLRALRVLELGGDGAREVVRALARAPQQLAKLRVIRVLEETPVDDLLALAARYGDQLELLETPSNMPVPALVVAGEVRPAVAQSYGRHPTDELLHHAPAAMLALGAPWCAHTPTIAIARLDPVDKDRWGPVWEIAPRPVDDRVLVGRTFDNDIRLDSQTISRRQVQLRWRNGCHHVEDMGSTNGVHVDRQRVQTAELADGIELQMGSVILQYFVGPGARERAEAAAARAKTIDASTRLPINPAPPFLVEIVNWPEVRRGDSIRAIDVMRAVTTELAWFAGAETIWFVRPGAFGVEAGTAERIGARTITVIVDEAIEVQLKTS